MQINSHDLAHCADYLVTNLKEITDKIKFYGKEECKKKGNTNFCLSISENDDIFLIKIKRVLSEKENVSIDVGSVKFFQKKYDEAEQKFLEFDKLCDEIYCSPNGSLDHDGFCQSFSEWFESLFHLIWAFYLQFLERLETKDACHHE